MQRSLRRDLTSSLADGATYSVMVGVGETYLPAFALAAGMGEVLAGLVASVPFLGGAVIQLVSPRGIRLLGSHRRWVVAAAVLQATCFLPLAAMAFFGHVPAVLLFVLAAIYWGAGMATGPAWNAWVSGLVPKQLRPSFFARRARLAQSSVLLGLVGGGFLLQKVAAGHRDLTPFALMFLLAAACRYASSFFLTSQREGTPVAPAAAPVSLGGFVKRLGRGDDGKLLLYTLSVLVSVYIAAPFFTPLLLGEYKLSYGAYTLLISSSFVAKVVTVKLFGRLAKRTGVHRVLAFGALGLVPLPALWLLSRGFLWLLGIHLLSGVVWAAYELGTTLLTFERVSREEQTELLTYYNLASAIAMVVGGLVGAAILHSVGPTVKGYMIVLLASFLARSMSLFLARTVTGVDTTPVKMAMRILAVRPAVGAMLRPIFGSRPRNGE